MPLDEYDLGIIAQEVKDLDGSDDPKAKRLRGRYIEVLAEQGGDPDTLTAWQLANLAAPASST